MVNFKEVTIKFTDGARDTMTTNGQTKITTQVQKKVAEEVKSQMTKPNFSNQATLVCHSAFSAMYTIAACIDLHYHTQNRNNNNNSSASSVPPEVAYAVAVGSTSLAFSILMLFMEVCSRKPRKKANVFASIVTFVWWVFGTSVATFYGPFVDAGAKPNGYFSCWLALMLSAYYMFSSVRKAGCQLEKPIVTLGVLAVIQVFYLVSAVDVCSSPSSKPSRIMTFPLVYKTCAPYIGYAY
eukprot:Pgem_evm1s15334